MAVALWITALFIGATLWLASVLVVTTAAPDERFPWERNPSHRRAASISLRVAGVFFIVLPVSWGITPIAGYWGALPCLAAFAPGVLAIVLHNTSVTRRAARVD
ncbi:hypothetical protein RWH43_06875 [Microbacterium sp. KSW2-21]|uniref:DUF2516 family protein n=1 Tax=Microbacterium algihabitans TaxID=3075992 RepID=A0ABU3RUC5_9MICO|nr:hypothetical protein [Microbacterium sp. KSW2-21]MDU0326482.1 hypothetical protein [Microbacterium sp. KSW2-21]